MANILVLGGTGFLGPEVVNALLARKHKVTLFNRGKTHVDLFPDLEKLIGDRAKSDLKSLEGRAWDAVVDVGASHPKWVKEAAELLAPKVKTYVFVSTVSVYNDFSKPGMAEDGPTHADDPAMDAQEQITGETYGPMKVRCEGHVRRVFPNTATIVRPGLIVGPTDPTDRFTYWPYRINRGGEVLCPGDGSDAVQVVDLRDLGSFIADLVTDGHAGTYNATGPSGEWTLEELFHACKAATAAPVTFSWIPAEFLLARGVRPWSELPLWAPGAEMAGFAKVNCEKARAHGLSFRPLADTIRDTLVWNATLPKDRGFHAGMNREKALKILKEYHEATGTQAPTTMPTSMPTSVPATQPSR